MSGQTVCVDKNVEAYAKMQNYNVMCYNERVLELSKDEARVAYTTMLEVMRRDSAQYMKLERLFRKMHVVFNVALDADELLDLAKSLSAQGRTMICGPDWALCTLCILHEMPKGEEFPLKKCGRCKKITYCCRDAQKKDWTDRHKKECNSASQ